MFPFSEKISVSKIRQLSQKVVSVFRETNSAEESAPADRANLGEDLPPTLTSVLFEEAATIWLDSRRPYLSAKSIHEYELNIKTLSKWFGDFRLQEISADMIRAYQRKRLTDTRIGYVNGRQTLKTCGPNTINKETSCLQQMLKRVGRWSEIGHDFQPLTLPEPTVGKALTDEERKRLLDTAKSDLNWEAAYLFAVLSVNSGAGPKEVATLRLKSIDLDGEQLRIHPDGAKNKFRIRNLDLNDESRPAAKMALARAKRLGASDPDHYLFPFRVHRSLHNPTKHQTTFKTAWKRLTMAASLPGLRMYDLRHHAATVMAEDPNISDRTMMAVMGWSSTQMIKRYSHTRDHAKRNAVYSLQSNKPTNHPAEAPVPSRKQPKSDSLSMEEKLALFERFLKVFNK